MAITMNDVLAYLHSDEPSYDAAAAQLGAEALPYLRQLAEGKEAGLAGKAAYLAGLIGTTEAADVLRAAVHHFDASVRVAAAAAVSFVPADAAASVLRDLVRDEDAGVRRIAVQSVLDRPTPEFLETLRDVVSYDKDAYVRELAGNAVEQIERSRPRPPIDRRPYRP
jgi:HEAT repeat protein